jgi:ABC-type nitrate/sulfonate/bicarbonate transport system substrate-binding protein
VFLRKRLILHRVGLKPARVEIVLVAMTVLLVVFGGGRTSQAMTAGAVDISVQSGTEMAFQAKGVPGKAAALAGPPNELVLVVRPICRSARLLISRGARSA